MFTRLDRTRHHRTFVAGEDLVAMGSRPAYLYIRRSGRAKVWRPSRHGSTLTLYYIGAGAVAGLVSLVRDVPMLSSVTAVQAITGRPRWRTTCWRTTRASPATACGSSATRSRC